MNHIVEAITGDGIVTTPNSHYRMTTPRSGDFLRWPDGTIGRIWEAGTGLVDVDELHVCENHGSAFLNADGTVDISGGPFRVVNCANVRATYEYETGRFWNWGNNRPGKDQGVEYQLTRPLFEYVREEV